MQGLKEVLEEKNGGSALCSALEQVKKAATPLLSKITETFPDFTIHDIRHSEQVLNILDWLVSDELKQAFNAYEIYFLIMSVYLHDIGMVDFPELLEKDFEEFATREKRKTPTITQNEVKRKYIRETHSVRSERFTEMHFRDLMIEDLFQARIVGRICRGHRHCDLTDRKLFNNREMYSAKNLAINVPLLASLLRTADELDLTFERTPIIVYETLKPIDPVSISEWERHLSTCGCGLNPENTQQIVITARCWNPLIYRQLRNFEVRIQSCLKDVHELLFQYRELRRSLPQTVVMDVEAIGFVKLDFKFSLQEDQIVKLLMGEKLYSRKQDCLREVLQNCVDTCRRKAFLKENYQPSIVFKLSPDRKLLSISDNGMGMDKYIIENYFARIGRCFYTSPEFLEEGTTFTPASQFGIGIVSCFMMAEKIAVDTKTDDSTPLKLEIDGLSDYFLVTEGKRKESGTEVVLTLKNGEGEKLDLVREMSYFARHTLPVEVITPNGKVNVTDRGYNFCPRQAWHGHSNNPVEEGDEFLFRKFVPLDIRLDEENLEGQLHLIFRKDEELGFVPVHSFNVPKYGYNGNEVFVSNEGIFVGNFKQLAPSWLSNGLFGEINLHKLALDLNIARNDIIQNQKFLSLRRTLEGKIVEKIDEIFRGLDPTIEKKKALTRDFVNNYIDLSYYDNQKQKRIFFDLPETIVNIVKNSYYFECIEMGSETRRTWNEIFKERMRIVLIERYFLRKPDYLTEVVNGCSSLSWDGCYLYTPSDVEVASYLAEWDKKHGIGESPLTETRDVFKAVKYTIKEVDLPYFPVTWKLAIFENYKSNRLIEQFSIWGSDALINSEHRFIKLLLEGKKVINTADRERAVLVFLRELRKKASNYLFEGLQNEQKEILKWFKESGMIENVDDYLVTSKDFPPH